MKKSTSTHVVTEPVKPVVRSSRPQRTVPVGEPQRRPNGTHAGGQESNGEADLREILRALSALKKGDFSVRLPVHWLSTSGKVADAFNEVAELMEESTSDLNRINRVV